MENIFNTDPSTFETPNLTPELVLKYVDESDIFGLVFGVIPEEYDTCVSPFREDKNPGCIFSRDPKGKLRFCDFGNKKEKNGVKMSHMDCFDAVKVYFGLSNFRSTLEFIYNNLIKGKNLSIRKGYEVENSYKKEGFYFSTAIRDFEYRDKVFWFDSYGITKKNLIEDKVFAINKLFLRNTKKGDLDIDIKGLGYLYTDFESGHKKVYTPFAKTRFITDCKNDDIGGLRFLPQSGKKLIITKSYKDYRVLRNLGLNVVWFQNEGMFPSEELLISLCRRFESVVIFFDCDSTGIFSSIMLRDLINSFLPYKARIYHIPEHFLERRVKDPSDYYKKFGRSKLIELLQTHNVF